jgi:3-hexulose-6-phosphate synthase
MKLQLALDMFDIPQSIEILKGLADVIDIVEIGTPMIIREGVHAVKKVKDAFPDLTVLADLKIMDGGGIEAASAFDAGADIVTVLSVAENATIKEVVKTAKKYGKQVMADMIAVRDLAARSKELDQFGLDYLCVHTAFDVQNTGKNPLDELKVLNSTVKNTKTAVAGGIKLSTLRETAGEDPEIIVVGGGISNQADKRAAAIEMKKIISDNK